MKNITIKPDITIHQAMKKLGKAGERCLVVADDGSRLLGTLSDGDVRKAILRGFSFGDSIKTIFQANPTVLVKGEYEIEDARQLFIRHKYDLIPIVDQSETLLDVLFLESVIKIGDEKPGKKLDTPVVIMAGGKGTRLEPFTKVLPKPLVPIHDKPVIEHIIERFTDVGVNKFILTVNYKAKIMKAFFEELNPEYIVDFVEEIVPLGTAGSLKYMESKFKEPFVVTNCDIIIKADYLDLYAFHKKNNYAITLVASMKNYTIPYGTCKLNGDGHLSRINEKPSYEFLINTGLYVLNPDVLKLIPKNKVYHITHLIEDVKKIGKKVGVYPIDDEAWIDIGQWAEYKQAIDKLN